MLCKHCKAEMKEIYKSHGWIQKDFYWCPECGTMLKDEHTVMSTTTPVWYKPGYLIEQEGI